MHTRTHAHTPGQADSLPLCSRQVPQRGEIGLERYSGPLKAAAVYVVQPDDVERLLSKHSSSAKPPQRFSYSMTTGSPTVSEITLSANVGSSRIVKGSRQLRTYWELLALNFLAGEWSRMWDGSLWRLVKCVELASVSCSSHYISGCFRKRKSLYCCVLGKKHITLTVVFKTLLMSPRGQMFILGYWHLVRCSHCAFIFYLHWIGPTKLFCRKIIACMILLCNIKRRDLAVAAVCLSIAHLKKNIMTKCFQKIVDEKREF